MICLGGFLAFCLGFAFAATRFGATFGHGDEEGEGEGGEGDVYDCTRRGERE